jgi:hypothetical protein
MFSPIPIFSLFIHVPENTQKFIPPQGPSATAEAAKTEGLTGKQQQLSNTGTKRPIQSAFR